jgi:transcriptional regulator with XRE-family HTH domain
MSEEHLDNLLKIIGERLQEIRTHLGYLQKAFAKEMEISGASLSEIEAGNVKPRFELIYNITRKFDVNINYLLHGEGEMFMKDETYRLTGFDMTKVDRTFLEEFVDYFSRSELVRTHVMGFFRRYMIENAELIEKEIQLYEKRLKKSEETET